mgnify:CR=1 FL=1
MEKSLAGFSLNKNYTFKYAHERMHAQNIISQIIFMFKGDYYINKKYEVEFNGTFSWLKGENTYSHHMGSEHILRLKDDLGLLINKCQDLGISLPESFVFLMSNQKLHQYFRSLNDNFFDLVDEPIKCTFSDGYLINIIADSQYCHFIYLYIEENSSDYKILWSEKFYGDMEDFEYEVNFDESDLYLLDDNFEHFMYHNRKVTEERFSENSETYRESYQNHLNRQSYNGVMDMSDNDARFLHTTKFLILSFTSIIGVFVSMYSYYMAAEDYSIEGEVISIDWPMNHQDPPVIHIRDYEGHEHELPSYRVSLTPEQIKKGDSFSKIRGLKDCKINALRVKCVN